MCADAFRVHFHDNATVLEAAISVASENFALDLGLSFRDIELPDEHWRFQKFPFAAKRQMQELTLYA